MGIECQMCGDDVDVEDWDAETGLCAGCEDEYHEQAAASLDALPPLRPFYRTGGFEEVDDADPEPF